MTISRSALFAVAVALTFACDAHPSASADPGGDPEPAVERPVARPANAGPATMLAATDDLPADEPVCSAQTPPNAAVPVDAAAELVQGSLRVKHDDQIVGLPLRETRYDTLVTGTVAETSVVQVFGNPFDEAIEAVYVFPLPNDGAVDDYWMHVGDRHIHGVMKKRDEARKIYEEARAQGKSAGLLEQERPNIFTQSIANIPPGESIRIEMHVVQPLRQESGVYTLALPTVVGPRYIPEGVADAAKISPPVLAEGTVPCANLSITVNIDSGLPARDLQSKFHAVDVSDDGDTRFVELADGKAIPNRDFELSWRLAGDEPQASLMAQRGSDGGFFTLTVQPPERAPSEQAAPRELIFVVDNSGSMSGAPIEAAKAAMRLSLKSMRANDAFQVIRFSESASALGAGLLANTPANVEKGLAYVDAMRGMGGTRMVEGIKAALDMPGEPGRMRIVLFMTDGYIGNEVEIFEAIEDRLGGARLFSMGVGSSVNRYLLDGMASIGRGAVTYMGHNEQPDAIVERFYARIAHPLLTDIEIDWQGLEVSDVVPARIPDLFVGQPVVVFGKYQGEPSGEAVLRGTLAGKPVELPLRLDFGSSEQASGLASMWARKRIDDLLGYPSNRRGKTDDTIESRVVELALAYRVMTQYTSFVAVDESRVANPDGTYRTVQVPVAMPEGVEYSGVFGGEDRGGAGHGRYGGTGYKGGGKSYGLMGASAPTAPMAAAPVARRERAARDAAAPRKQVAEGKPTVTGDIDRSVIRRAIRRKQPAIERCYQQRLKAKPGLAGKLVVTFTISKKGVVLEVKAKGMNDQPFEACVAAVFKSIKFPASAGVVKINYPLHFKPR